MSVNGGAFALVPASAFEQGPYNDTLLEPIDEFGEIYNTNPLADQVAFTGPDVDPPAGSWIESRVDLAGIADPVQGIGHEED